MNLMKKLTKELEKTLIQLDEEAEELINNGNSREKAEGYGMKKVLKVLKNNENTKII
jgi:hypothetical protein